MTTIHDLLDEYAALAPDMRTKGLLLERLTRSFLKTDPSWTSRFSDVWLWEEWPDRAGKVDTGIDLVAQERFGGGVCAIQCKFFDPKHVVQKADIDSFFTASGKNPFTERLIVSTTEKWSKHATDALLDQQIPTARVGVIDFERSDIDWAEYSFSKPDDVPTPETKTLRPHQQRALDAVRDGFDATDRGKLIMACGTGKTFTSLRIAEELAGRGGSVLFLVPSIALLSQTLKEWTAERNMPMRAFAICSDTKVGKNNEDLSVSDLEYPATTNTNQLLKAIAKAEVPDGLTVYFSTYQSIDVVAEAQREGLPEFDLVVCDEAHRTAGFSLSGAEQSAFLRVHDSTAIGAKRRLYMTATPKIYAEAARGKAADAAAVLYSMDDEAVFGPEFHRLGFGEAVEQNLLSDYRVLVLAVDERSVSAAFQHQFAEEGGELNIPEAARLVGIYNGLAKRGVQGLGDSAESLRPLRRAVTFSRSIADSKAVQEMLHGYRGARDEEGDPVRGVAGPRFDRVGDRDVSFNLQAKHVDGTMNVLERNNALDWLKAEVLPSENVCRILTNARCLSEGVDVPALDAVIFLNSRDSQVDVVQSVGRVMRRAPGKDYGYIVLPVAVPEGITPEQALNDNQKYKVVWEVLRALRAHDERFEAKIEQIDLNGKPDPQLQGVLYADKSESFVEHPEGPGGTQSSMDVALDWSALGADWEQAIYAKIVQKVGEREYWENWARDVADIARRQRTRIGTLLDAADFSLQAEFQEFLGGLRDNLNPSISRDDAIDMLSQHLITEPVFNALFETSEFSQLNPVARVMDRMIGALEGSNLETERQGLESFYASVRRSVTGITDATGKQTIIKRLYEKFFVGAFRSTSDRLGIVYTPSEIVDFLLHSADSLSRKHFGSGLTDSGVHVLDPFTGTGTFVVRLFQSGLIKAADVERKYRNEVHANEIVLLAYYVAAANIEATYNAIAETLQYQPYPGIVLTDTFQSSESDDALDVQHVFGENDRRVRDQNALDVTVIVGNPPYSVGQESENDDNRNAVYPQLDARIAETYAALSNAQNKSKLYDSYIRAIRWAQDRLGSRGIIAFVTNGSFLSSNSADGLRKTLVNESSEIYVLNLRGNQRTAGEESRREGGKVFGAGSRATVAITLIIKDPAIVSTGRVHYADIGDYLSREEKLATVSNWATFENVPWQYIMPNSHGDWLQPRSKMFEGFTPVESGRNAQGLFVSSSNGLLSGRDAWVYNFSCIALERNMRTSIGAFNAEVVNAIDNSVAVSGPSRNLNPTEISWTTSLISRVERGETAVYTAPHRRVAQYRPFNKQWVYADPMFIHRPSRNLAYFAKEDNYGFVVTSANTTFPSFAALMTDAIPDFHLVSTDQFFPRYVYLDDGSSSDLTRTDNVDSVALERYRALYGRAVSADDVFFAVYGVLHSTQYRSDFGPDLKKSLPRIPDLETAADFWEYVEAGRGLSALHLGYESVEPWPLEVRGIAPQELYVEKMRYGGKAGAWDKSIVNFTERLAIVGIPLEVQDYKLGSRSALDWVLERYQVKTDKASGIVNDPNDWGREHGDPLYIFNLVQRIVRVSMETVAIVNSLPPLRYVVPTKPAAPAD